MEKGDKVLKLLTKINSNSLILMIFHSKVNGNSKNTANFKDRWLYYENGKERKKRTSNDII